MLDLYPVGFNYSQVNYEYFINYFVFDLGYFNTMSIFLKSRDFCKWIQKLGLDQMCANLDFAS